VGFVVGVEKVPARAASRLKGRPSPVVEAKGDSIRAYGADTRRFFTMPAANLRFGDLPAGAVNAARVVGTVGLAGVVRRDGTLCGGGIAFAEGEVEMNVNGLEGFSRLESSLLLFLDGEARVEGSMFSLSTSSKVEISKGRFAAVEAREGFVKDRFAFPLRKVDCAARPVMEYQSVQHCDAVC